MKPLLALLVFFCAIGIVYGGVSWASASIVSETGPTPIAGGGLMLTTGVVLLMKGGG